jgi:TonB family protein
MTSPHLRTVLLCLAIASAAALPAAAQQAAAQPPDAPRADVRGAPQAVSFAAEVLVTEVGFDARLRLRLYHDPAFVSVPSSAGTLFLVVADSSAGRDAFFIASDIAFELGDRQEYRVEFEQASDLLGQALGGRLRPGEVQLGFVLVPSAADFTRYFPAHPESVVVRYANHRSRFHRASAAESLFWRDALTPSAVAAGLNAWWDWTVAMSEAPDMNEGEMQFFQERLFPAQGHLLAEEGIKGESLRNAILRVGERRLLEGPASQRVAPRYPSAARQLGVGGLVIALCYVDESGKVADAVVLASNTAHMLNLSALSAAMEWRFPRQRDPGGVFADGWRLLPFQFKLTSAAPADTTAAAGNYLPPRIVRSVEPEYPEAARKRRIEGTVVYRATIAADGKLTEAVLEAGAHELLNQAALEALERMIFIPASRDGKSVPGQISVPFTFGAPKEKKKR